MAEMARTTAAVVLTQSCAKCRLERSVLSPFGTWVRGGVGVTKTSVERSYRGTVYA